MIAVCGEFNDFVALPQIQCSPDWVKKSMKTISLKESLVKDWTCLLTLSQHFTAKHRGVQFFFENF